ncbi:MFS transporter [Paracraurococcus ruber]|uniref:MFS transporter n=1 Tax=Paracraurococcus ruber TaxID=77675 RepID=A0ABS1D2F8_9PROT|nr:MFS transporter [Paracraurococcus ruber]MBK1660625.1 MFS transporter [Paracraurococcus ruber]TDG27483.1 MFS transporter [Paracraurococcus ruber]
MRAPASPGQVLAIVCAGIVLANLDLFIVNVALPDIARDFGDANLGDLSWILNGYAIVYAALLVLCGRLAERYPRNLSFLAGIALFTIASAACALANSVWTLVAFRLLQAAGAALLTPTSLGLILATFPAERRGGAVRTWAAIGGFAAALGPLVGGLLVTISWRWIFLVNVPIGVLALVVGAMRLPRIPGHDVPVPSTWAAALITIGISALAFGIVKVNDWGWSSVGVSLSFAVAAATLALFVAHCRSADAPFIDPALFRIRDFTRATLTMAPFSTAFGGFLLSLVLWQEGVWHWPAEKIGLAIAPGPFMVPVTSLLLSGPLIRRFGPTRVVAAGLAVFAAGVVVWALAAGPQADLAFAMLCVIPSGIGVGLTLPTLMGLGTSALPVSSFATGSGVINMVRQIGFAVGVAIFVAIVAAPGAAEAPVAAFRLAWWVMAAITVVGLIPLAVISQRGGTVTAAGPRRSA